MDHLLVFRLFISSIQSNRWLTLQPGGNVTIPCHYDNKYIRHKKFWCYHPAEEFNY
ncbi:hypothetical protein MHYP_G00237880 [Metynnis hypsauchen]